MHGRSKYRDSKAEQFEFDIVGECIDESFNEPAYKCLLLKKYQNQFRDGNKIFTLRKKLFGGELYEIVASGKEENDDVEIYIQLNLFDFIGD